MKQTVEELRQKKVLLDRQMEVKRREIQAAQESLQNLKREKLLLIERIDAESNDLRIIN